MKQLAEADAEEIAKLRQCVSQGKGEAVGAMFDRYRSRLRRMVILRMDRRVQGRIDPSDVIQDAFMEATRRLNGYVGKPRMPLFLWLRFLAAQRLLQLHRRHLGAEARDAGREISLYRGRLPEATSAVLAEQLVSRRSSPSQAAIRIEMKVKLQEALNAMEPAEREVLALRHFEGLTNLQVARVLGLREAAASQRYVRALQRLKRVFEDLESGKEPARG